LNKRNVIVEMVKKCETDRKILLEIDNRQHILLFVRKYSDNVYLFKFCRDFPITKYDFDELNSDVIESKESNFPYIFVLVDTEKQIICLESKTTVFQKIESCRNIFKGFVITYIHDLDYTFSMDEITFISTFWEIIASCDKIYELKLNLKSPNLFGGIYDTNQFLKNLKESFNNDETDVKLKSNSGNLKVTHEELEDPLKYAGGGGGHWELSVIKRGRTKKTTIKSNKSVKTIEIKNFEEEFKFFSDNEILEKINSIDDTFDQ